jgi:hypothetical protein
MTTMKVKHTQNDAALSANRVGDITTQNHAKQTRSRCGSAVERRRDEAPQYVGDLRFSEVLFLQLLDTIENQGIIWNLEVRDGELDLLALIRAEATRNVDFSYHNLRREARVARARLSEYGDPMARSRALEPEVMVFFDWLRRVGNTHIQSIEVLDGVPVRVIESVRDPYYPLPKSLALSSPAPAAVGNKKAHK